MVRASNERDPGEVRLFAVRPVVIGVLHLPALPGSPRNAMDTRSILRRAREEAEILQSAGFHAVIVENFGDAPFWASQVPPQTVSAMTRVATEVVWSAPNLVVGVNVLRNDAAAALAIAATCEAEFIRVNVHTGVYATDQGIIEGRAAETLRLRRLLGHPVSILADVHVKHAQPVGHSDLADAAIETAYRGLADALIVTGSATGKPTSLDDARVVRQAVPDRPLLIGSGVTPATVGEALRIADGVIVGSTLRKDGRAGAPLDLERVQAFAAAAGLQPRGE